MSSSPDPFLVGGDWPARYTVWVRGQLDPRWAEWFMGLAIATTTSGDSTLSGLIEDQAALHGLLERIRDLNLTLIAVQRHQSGKPNGGNHGIES